MQIALTKILAEAMEIKPASSHGDIPPLFTWTANWVKVWDNSRTGDMLVLVNNATRFVVAVYQVKRKDLKNVSEMMTAAIRNTLLAMNVNPEIVEAYMKLAGEVEFVANHTRQATAWVNRAGMECASNVSWRYYGASNIFNDTVGAKINYIPVSSSSKTGSKTDTFEPEKAMFTALAELTGKPIYKYRAFEILVTLDLYIYKATRRLIVPADIRFAQLHGVLQTAFHWEGCHLHDFEVFAGKSRRPDIVVVMDEEARSYHDNAVLEDEHVLSDFFPQFKRIVYTYDMGDSWEHQIKLVRVIEEHNEKSPYLLEAIGQTPPEDVGGVGGFINFREIMMNPDHEEYEEMKEWSGYWKPELGEWETRPRPLFLR
jgi:hypothetical protein